MSVTNKFMKFCSYCMNLTHLAMLSYCLHTLSIEAEINDALLT